MRGTTTHLNQHVIGHSGKLVHSLCVAGCGFGGFGRCKGPILLLAWPSDNLALAGEFGELFLSNCTSKQAGACIVSIEMAVSVHLL